MSGGATKWKGVCAALDSLGISAGQSVYFGDDNDDLEPVKLCGTGVAVSNAIPAVLSAADRTAGSCDCDGVARFVEKYVL